MTEWQRRAGRHGLPWQGTRDPYRVWLSEIMLQQTRVATVVPAYARFLARFPDLASLAAAPVDDVLGLWSGLGYYSRARNLHCAAGVLAARGGFPASVEALQQLPGIGRSTAAAIVSLAFDHPAAILDGNVRRVLARHAGIGGWPGEPVVARRLWAEAESRLPPAAAPAGTAAAYTQALMDLGAMVCHRRRPQCADCPVAADCVARLEGSIEAIPAPRPARHRPLRRIDLLLDCTGDGVVLLRRAEAGVWGGLWCLPEGQGGTPLLTLSHELTH
ncbi:MAG: A/G-specific adenine glycosylase, partial [Rhodocyclaceae bacterium]|nr:A/G-specific adenine glycosylase [Rhodocyclaceae bacterium]